MTAKVLSILPDKPIQDTVQVLEAALEMARKGELIAMCYAAVLKDGSIQTAVAPDCPNVLTMLGAIERLKLRYYELHIDMP